MRVSIGPTGPGIGRIRGTAGIAALFLMLGAVTPLQVTNMNPAPGSVSTSAPTVIQVTLNRAVAPSTVSAETCRLVRPGPDGAFGTADDIVIRPASVTVTGSNKIKIEVTAPLSNDSYRVTLKATPIVFAGLAAHWKFDEGAGTVAADSSGHGLTGTVNGATWTAGKLGKALNFATGGDHVALSAADIPEPWTAAMWVNRQPCPDPSAILMNGGVSALKLEQYPGTGAVGFTAYGVEDYVFGYSAPVGIWTHLAFVATPGGMSLYVNGGLAGTIGASIPLPMALIGNSAGHAMRGILDDVRIYNRNLLESELQQLAAFRGTVSDSNDVPLDGEFSESFPSGDGVAGGDFVASFTVSAPPPPAPRASHMTPSPGSVLSNSPSSVIVSFNRGIAPASVSMTSCRLVRAGVDGVLGTGDDVAVTPVSVMVTGTNNVRFDLLAGLPNDLYQVTLSGTSVSPSGLVAHWKLDEGAGTVAGDASGNGYSGTLNGPSWTAPGRVGAAALNFNGTINQVSIGAPSIAPPWTASMWVKRQDSFNNDARLMDSEAFPAGCSLRLEQFPYTKQVGVTRYGVVDATFNYSAPLDTWTHLSFIGTETTTLLYVNGAFVDVIPMSFELPMFNLGSHGDHALLGTLDDVRVYNRALTPSELQILGAYPSTITGTDGTPIDGEFTGTLPSGNGTPGGDFVATFRIQRR